MKKALIVVLAIAVVVTCVLGMVACGKKAEYTFGKEVVAVNAQYDILTGMSTGSADVGVMDSIMAGYYMKNSEYKDTMELLPFDLSEEEYGIGAKKGNDALIGKINEALIELYKEDSIIRIGNEFGVSSENLISLNTVNPKAEATDNSWNTVVTAKKLIVGYTVFAPIAYTQDGVFTGYDIELARATVAYLNKKYGAEIELEFIEIDWDQKETLLENGSIDLVWNGMTITDERIEGMSMSVPYLANKQAIVIMKKDKEKYDLTSLDAFKASAKDAIVYVESGSAAEEVMVIKK
jgi:polar amino acid transport system substrate-binding protein